MTNVDVILGAIGRLPGATDTELRLRTGVEPHQQVNQICRRLAGAGHTVRRRRPDGLLGNYPVNAGANAEHELPTKTAGRVPLGVVTSPPMLDRTEGIAGLPGADDALLVLPCSKAKRAGAASPQKRREVTSKLSPPLAASLTAARRVVAGAAHLDERQLMPANLRYAGFLYRAGHEAISRAVGANFDLAILSGGYGVLDPCEPIGDYDRAFRPSDWPHSLLQRALLELAAPHGHVVAFCSRTTSYAHLLRSVRWSAAGYSCHLLYPDTEGRGGAQVLVPRATGEALGAYLQHRLDTRWRSSDGLSIKVEVLR